MAIRKMKMMQLVAPLQDLTKMLVTLFHTGGLQLVETEKLIDRFEFTIPVTAENMNKTVDISTARNFEKGTRTGKRRNAALRYMNKTERQMGNIFDRDQLTTEPTLQEEAVLAELMLTDEKLEETEAKRKRSVENLELVKLLIANDIEHTALSELKNFIVHFGTLTELSRRAIRAGYEKVPAAILHLGEMNKEELYLILAPKEVETDIHRLEDSLNWKKLNPVFPEGKTNRESLAIIERNIEGYEEALTLLRQEKDHMIHRHQADLEGYYYAIALDDAVDKAKQYLAQGTHYFYLTGWVSESDEGKFRKVLSGFDDIYLDFLREEQVSMPAPTQLENNRLTRPFEAMVHMYGTPNYRELDPTNFFAITYVILFGAMFGDLGQGAVFALLGWYLGKHRHPNLGGVVLRMGLSSMVFGLLYGSVFGLEEVIPALLIRPFESINTVLIAAIVFGVLLTIVAYGFGIVNKLRMKEYQEAWFGKEGIAGFGLYLSMILLVVDIAVKPVLPIGIVVALILICLAAVLFQQPLTHLILKKRPLYNGDAGGYYVETGFSLLEAVISIFSGVLSFIRVGAFAINHVGLFMAFSTMGAMIGGAGNVLMLVIGNIVIIGLEGLIVFIQSLRLEYYELFGKYYVGNGVPFEDTKHILAKH